MNENVQSMIILKYISISLLKMLNTVVLQYFEAHHIKILQQVKYRQSITYNFEEPYWKISQLDTVIADTYHLLQLLCYKQLNCYWSSEESAVCYLVPENLWHGFFSVQINLLAGGTICTCIILPVARAPCKPLCIVIFCIQFQPFCFRV